MLRAIPTCESEYGVYGCGAGGTPTGSARPWIAIDLLPRSQPRYNMEGSFYDTRQFGGAFGPVTLPGGPEPVGLPPILDVNGNLVPVATVNPNHLETNSLAPIVILGIAALLLLG